MDRAAVGHAGRDTATNACWVVFAAPSRVVLLQVTASRFVVVIH
ncbi:hypothetical protein [Tabrizicola sp.]|nr:hypothetical protein [Tabrizicola sp.]